MGPYEKLVNSQCFVHGYALDGAGGGLPLAQTLDCSQQAWIHLDYSADDCIPRLRELGLPEAAIDGLVRVDTRPRAMQIHGGMLLILRGLNVNPGHDPEDMVSLRLWVEKNRLISLRQRRTGTAQEIREHLDAHFGPVTIQDLLFAIIEDIASRIADYVDALENQLSGFEDRVDQGHAGAQRREVSSLWRQSAAIRRYLAPQRDALESFHRQARDILDENYMLYIQEQADRMMRYVEDLDLIREKILVLQEELMNRLAHEQNSRMYVLSLVAAIFLPVTFVTGLFGMNVAGLPGLQEPHAFWLVLLGMLIVAVGTVFWFRSKHWM